MKCTYNDFVQLCCDEFYWPEEDVRRVLAAHLAEAHVTEQDVEIYLNYPEYTEKELAVMFGMRQQNVSNRLTRVRRAWPSLMLHDPVMDGKRGSPELRHMLRIEFSNSDRLDDDGTLIKF